MEVEETTGGCTLIMPIGVYWYRTTIRKPRSRISVWFVERKNVNQVIFCSHVRGQHGSFPAIRYYRILVEEQTHLYEIPYSALAGCIEQDNRISCQDNRSAGGHFRHILGLSEV